MLIGIDASRADVAQPTGVERLSQAWIAALIQAAPHHRLRLYHRRETHMPAPSHVEHCLVRPPRLWTHVGLAREIMHRPPDALFVPGHVMPWVSALPFMRGRIRLVATVHDLGYRHFPRAHPPLQWLYLELGTRFSVRVAHAVITISHATRRDIVAHYRVPPERVHVAYPALLSQPTINDVLINQTLKRLSLARDRFVLHIGTQQPRKNLRRLIAAWARSSLSHEYALALAGAGGWGNEDLRATAAAHGVQDSVRVIGYVDEPTKWALLYTARAYALPSLAEGFGLPVLEAQSVGLPIACSRLSALPEVAGDGATYFDPLDEDSIAEALQQVTCDPDLRQRLREAGYRNLQRFSWEASARVILAALLGEGGQT